MVIALAEFHHRGWTHGDVTAENVRVDIMNERSTKPIERGKGATAAERFLARLCERSFLSMWSYPGVYRNQGNSHSGDGKEVCDLLVVFENHIIIFSDKDCDFPRTGNVDLDWSRWYRKAIRESARQVWGAERWIREFPDRLYLDRGCTVPLPISLPPPDRSIYHRIVVAHAASARCAEQYGGSGSLMIRPDIIGDQHMKSIEDGGVPFTIGRVSADKGYIHVFDDTTLAVIMMTLDTVTDFTEYLTKKEQFIASGRLLGATGEDDLLASYLMEINAQGKHDFVIPNEVPAVTVGDGLWDKFTNSEQRKVQIEADRVSYAWDALIEVTTQHAFGGTSYFRSHPGIESQERILRFLAREPRTRRRFLAQALVEFIEQTPSTKRATRTVLPSKPGDPLYVFMVLPHLQSVPYEVYREARRTLLVTHCMMAKASHPHAEDIVGIATESGRSDHGSEDFVYLDARTWTAQDQAEAERQRKELAEAGFLGKPAMYRTNVKEYPDSQDQTPANCLPVTMKGRDRNAACPCGSGRKYKKCCGPASRV